MREEGFRLDSGGETAIGERYAFVVAFTGADGDKGEPRTRIVCLDHGRSMYELCAWVESVRSFRPLTAAEAEAI
jgi:hypothetical protein